MRLSRVPLWISSFVVIFYLSGSLQAQRFELHPYAGGVLSPSNIGPGEFPSALKSQGIFGIRGDVLVTRNLELGGNFAYLDDFELDSTDLKNRAYLWEATGSYRFNLEKVKPFLSVGVGGITLDPDDRLFVTPLPIPLLEPETFFTVSYGGGLKVPTLWGPVGLRADIRGRTLPDFLGEATTWLEATGGITLTF